MGDPGFVRYPGCLDPRAEEFRPRNPNGHNQMPLIQPQIYYPYPPPSEVQVMPLYDGVGYPQYSTRPAHVSPSRANPPLPPPLPPPSTAPTRTLLLSSVPTDVSESEVRRELEVFGDVRAVEMKRVRDGVVTVHFYDLRNAQAAAAEIRRQHMQQQSRLRRHFDAVLAHNSVYELQNLVAPPPPPVPGIVAGHAVWAQFKLPEVEDVPDGLNQGTLVIFNLDPNVSTSTLKQIFGGFGPVKELRETPFKRHQRFVEFYDVRDAGRALSEMNGKQIHGKSIVIEFSRPGGHVNKFAKSSQSIPKNFNFCNYVGKNPGCLPPLQLPPSPLRKVSGNLRPHSSNMKKLGFCEGNPNRNGGSGEECDNRPVKKNTKKTSGANQQQQQQQVQKISRALKGKQGKNLDPRFLINGDAIMESNCRDSRTTVMIKNIPNKYSQKLLLNMLDNHCIHCNEQIADGHDDDDDAQPLSSYDFVYLPIDFINKCNVGYGFVNMTSPQATWRLYKAFHLQNWEVFNSKKICEVTYARLQGVDALKEHFKNSKFPCEAEEYLPVVFSPPRDGLQLTEPDPIVARATTAATLQSSPTTSSKNSETDDDDKEEREAEESNAENIPHHDGGSDNHNDGVSGGGSSITPNGGDDDRDQDHDQ